MYKKKGSPGYESRMKMFKYEYGLATSSGWCHWDDKNNYSFCDSAARQDTTKSNHSLNNLKDSVHQLYYSSTFMFIIPEPESCSWSIQFLGRFNISGNDADAPTA